MRKTRLKAYYENVIISPHLDDAVYSCGGLISQKPGQCLVINVFTSFPKSERKSIVDLNSNRNEEEVAAQHYLDFDSICLGFEDAVFRQPSYQKAFQLFGDPISQDAITSRAIGERLAEIFREVNADNVYFPLGIGWHVDHLICFHLGIALHSDLKNSRILFYEDTPYAFFHDVRRARLLELKLGLSAHHGRNTVIRLSTLPTFSPFNRWPLRLLMMAILSGFLLRKFRQRRAQQGQVTSMDDIVLIENEISEVLEKKHFAMQLYASQWRQFFHSVDHLRYLNPDTVERYWTLDRFHHHPDHCLVE